MSLSLSIHLSHITFKHILFQSLSPSLSIYLAIFLCHNVSLSFFQSLSFILSFFLSFHSPFISFSVPHSSLETSKLTFYSTAVEADKTEDRDGLKIKSSLFLSEKTFFKTLSNVLILKSCEYTVPEDEISVTRFDYFWKIFATNFLAKVAHIFSDFMGLLIMLRLLFGHFWSIFVLI